MRDVIIALIPAILVSFLFYGWSELLVLAVSCVSCVGLEWLISLFPHCGPWFGSTLLVKRAFWIITPFMLVGFALQFILLGLLAELQIRTYHECQNKPIYHIRETFDSPR